MIMRAGSIAEFFEKPLAIHRPYLDRMAADMPAIAAGSFGPPDGDMWRGFAMISGVAIIPVQGVLSKSCPWWCDGTSYDAIRAGFTTAMDDPDVRAVLFDVNSPGGTVEGCFDLVDMIYSARGTKPIWSVLGESAYSAAYAIACAADHMTIPRTGGAGSIGVVTAHVDVSKMLKNIGVKFTYIQYGAKKTDGAPEKPLSDDARACAQAEVDAMGAIFVETVARNRSMAAETIKGTEAACFMGADAVSRGLCDAVMAPDVAFSALLSKLG